MKLGKEAHLARPALDLTGTMFYLLFDIVPLVFHLS
jgi:hypothetical protein